MTAKEVLKLARQELLAFMENHGYRKSAQGYFIKSQEGFEKCITFIVSRWSDGSGFHVDHYAAYRLPAFAEIHNRYLSHVSEREKKLTPTISVYFLNLVSQGFDWKEVTVAGESDILRVAANIERICMLFSFPFLDRFASSDAIVQGFRGERNTWPVQDPILRFELLLLDSVLKHDSSSFNRSFDEALQFCEGRKDGRAVWLSSLAQSLKEDYWP